MEKFLTNIEKMISKINIDTHSAKILCKEEIDNKIEKLEKINEEIKSNIRTISSHNSNIKPIERKIIWAIFLGLITGPIFIGFPILFIGTIIYFVVQLNYIGKVVESYKGLIEGLDEEYDELRESIENFQDECFNLFDDWQEIDIPLHPIELSSTADRKDRPTNNIKPTISKSHIEKSDIADPSTIKSSVKSKVKFSLYDFLQIDISATNTEVNDAIKKVESRLLAADIDDAAKAYSRSLIAHAKTHLLDPVKRMEYNKSNFK